MDWIEQMAAVAVVLLLLGATLWALRRRGYAGMALTRKPGGRRMECVERIPIGPQQVLHLIRMGNTELLLASSPSGCRLLKSFGNRGEEERL